MMPTNDGRVRQRLLIRCYSYGHGYVNNQSPFSAWINCQNRVFLGFIGPNTTPNIIQIISKMWDEVYNNRVIARVHGLILLWPNHWREGPRKLGSAPVICPYQN